MKPQVNPLLVIVSCVIILLAIIGWLVGSASPEKTSEPAANNQSSSAIVSLFSSAPPWTIVTIKKGEDLASIFQQHHLPAKQLQQVMQLGKPVEMLYNLTPGVRLKLQISANNSLVKLAYPLNLHKQLVVSKIGNKFQATTANRDLETKLLYAEGVIHHSLFDAGTQAGLSEKQIEELTHIFGWDIDFAHELRPGDKFDVLYREYYVDGKKYQHGKIIAAEFTNRNKTYTAIYFNNGHGLSGYYTPAGINLQKPFLRAPVKYTRISSKFSWHRWHPILHIYRPHTGVDFAAPRGTPIHATASGRIIFRGRRGGYGNLIILRNSPKYTTYFAHMSAFNRKLKIGSHVTQDQVIGYVGMTGLATGPHCHYEIRVYGSPKNPLKIKLPPARPIAKKYHAEFSKQAKQLLVQMQFQKQQHMMMAAHDF